MVPLAVLLFTHVELIDALWKYGPFAIVLIKYVYDHFAGPSKKAEEEAKKERDKLKDELSEHNKRLNQVEEVDRTAYPAFKALCEDFKKLEQTVTNHHEQRLTGITQHHERTAELYEEKLKNHTKRVDDLEKRLDKIDSKLDKIMDEVMKINRM